MRLGPFGRLHQGVMGGWVLTQLQAHPPQCRQRMDAQRLLGGCPRLSRH
jgi:hypothetical protein